MAIRKTGIPVPGAPAPDDDDDEATEPRAAEVFSGQQRKQRRAPKSPKRGYLDGQMLIAMPTMGDERFVRSVIYVCAHSTEGAMGIIVNQPAPNITFGDLLVQLEVVPATDSIQLPSQASGVKVLKGGPVDTQRGFVLHSSDFVIENSTLPIDEGICLTERWISSKPSPAATARAARYWRWATPAGLRASWKRRSSITDGCIARPMLI